MQARCRLYNKRVLSSCRRYCLDWIHAVEKLWSCQGKANQSRVAHEADPLARTWVHEQKSCLLRAIRLDRCSAVAPDRTRAAPPSPVQATKYQRTVLGTRSIASPRTERGCAIKRFTSVASSSVKAHRGTVHIVGMRLSTATEDATGAPSGGRQSLHLRVRPSQRSIPGGLRVVPRASRSPPARVEAVPDGRTTRSRKSEDGGLNHALPVVQHAAHQQQNWDLHPEALFHRSRDGVKGAHPTRCRCHQQHVARCIDATRASHRASKKPIS
jgi:hypothetical protein